MGEKGKDLVLNVVSDEESFARWIYRPRYIDDKGCFNSRFVNLRERDNYIEDGISGQIYERAGKELVILSGLKNRWSNKDGTPKEEKFLGFAKAVSGDIRKVADEEDDEIDVVIRESQVPHHVVITFHINGELIKGNNQNPHFLRYKDKLKELLAKDVYLISEEELSQAKASLEEEL